MEMYGEKPYIWKYFQMIWGDMGWYGMRWDEYFVISQQTIISYPLLDILLC